MSEHYVIFACVLIYLGLEGFRASLLSMRQERARARDMRRHPVWGVERRRDVDL